MAYQRPYLEYKLIESYVELNDAPCPHCGRVNCGQQVLPFDQDEENAGDN